MPVRSSYRTETDKEARTFAETFISRRQGEASGRYQVKTVSGRSVLPDPGRKYQRAEHCHQGRCTGFCGGSESRVSDEAFQRRSSGEDHPRRCRRHQRVRCDLAAASNAIIIGFNVRPDAMAKQTAEREKVDMRLYRVIYRGHRTMWRRP